MKKLLCALLCLTLLLSSVCAFAASEKSEQAEITMKLNAFYIWSIPVDTDVVLFKKTPWGNVMATNILLPEGKELNLYMNYSGGEFAMVSATSVDNKISYNLYNTDQDTLAEDAVPLALTDFEENANIPDDYVYKLIGSGATPTGEYGEGRADIVTHIYYETTNTPPAQDYYEDTVGFYAVVEDAAD